MGKALVFVVLLVALMLLLVAPAALAIVDEITPADECSAMGEVVIPGSGVGSAAADALIATGNLTEGPFRVFFPVPNHAPGNANVTGNPHGVPDACAALNGTD